MIILIHSSKTMRPAAKRRTETLSRPILLDQADELMMYLKSLPEHDIETTMKLSAKLAASTKELTLAWSTQPTHQRAAVDSFLGDIYSGLQVSEWTDENRSYAQQHLRILSGLYGILKPLDGIYPYRFEMGYRLPDQRYANLYTYWNTAIVDTLPKNDVIIDLTAVEYGKTVTKYVEPSIIVTPRFLTISPKTGQPTFVVMHAKIARGAFAGWMVRHRINEVVRLKEFVEIGYRYDTALSTPQQPVFVCQTFEGLGLSVRLT